MCRGYPGVPVLAAQPQRTLKVDEPVPSAPAQPEFCGKRSHGRGNPARWPWLRVAVTPARQAGCPVKGVMSEAKAAAVTTDDVLKAKISGLEAAPESSCCTAVLLEAVLGNTYTGGVREWSALAD